MNRSGLELIAIAAWGLCLLVSCDSPPAKDGRQQSGRTAASQPYPKIDRSFAAARLLPPGAVIGSDSPAGDDAPIFFVSRQPPKRLLGWYRSAQRDRDFSIGSELQEGAEHVLNGSTHRPPGAFTVRLAPGAASGTSGMVLVTGR